jgi:hypothetical protein
MLVLIKNLVYFFFVRVILYTLAWSPSVNFLMLILTEILILYIPFGEKYKYYLRIMSIIFLYQKISSAVYKVKVNYRFTKAVIINMLVMALTNI